MRTFISLNIPKEASSKILEIQKKLPEFQGRKTGQENLHLTLKFLGEVEESRIEEIKKRLEEIKFKKFESEIDEIGFFSEDFIRIIWLHMTNCGKLQKIIDERLKGLFEPEKRFMSHLTIARIKNIKNRKKFLEELKKIKLPEIKLNVDKFYLMKSELTPKGSKYNVIGEYGLV